MSLKDKEELHNKSSGSYKASCDAPTSSSEEKAFNEELILMVKNFNSSTRVEARKEVPSQGPTMTKDLLVVSEIVTIVEDPDTTPMSVRPLQKKRRFSQKKK